MSTQQKRKLKVDIYVPTSRCSCDWEGFMNVVFEALMPHLKEIEFDTKNSESNEAKSRKLPVHCIVVGDEVFTSASALKARLPALIQQNRC
ncbi:MAG: hypothetical protein GYA24_08320 [Candidatus Lokiarchaeota archaeon]|nr:hypothetical protein [Candidatus Lokiarchaeota archaeon]